MENSFFVKCNMVRLSEIEFNKFDMTIKLPFYLHIKDIPNTFFDEEKENILEFYSSDLNQQYDNISLNKQHLDIIKFIDLKQFTIDEVLEGYKENMIETKNGYVFKNHNSLYSFLITELKFNEVDFILIHKFVRMEQIKILEEFSKMLDKEMKLGGGKDDISESYMLLRGAFELNHSNVLFPENKGLSFSEFSYREVRTQRVYLARKCEIEKAQYDAINKEHKINSKNKL